MKSVLKNILAILVGLICGGIINMSLVNVGLMIIPPPEGLDISTTEALVIAMPSFKPINFLFPFLAHAFGTFTGAIIAGLIAPKHKARFAFSIGLIFLIAGIMMAFQLPAPNWFSIVDVVFAYIPMAWMAGRLIENKYSK
ncbi:MAG: hypothetical protein ACI9YL_001686 [Luteibaculaceae bacterium]|jgi:hypothetical protein